MSDRARKRTRVDVNEYIASGFAGLPAHAHKRVVGTMPVPRRSAVALGVDRGLCRAHRPQRINGALAAPAGGCFTNRPVGTIARLAQSYDQMAVAAE